MKNTADRLFGDDYAWSALAVGRYQFRLCSVAGVLGGNVRVGMEENLYYSKGQLLKSNEEAVQKVRKILEELGFEIATPSEARSILGLKGKSGTKIGA
jgi:uncharacterized protein (DUF849 family)